MASEAVLRLGRNQALAGILVILVSIDRGYLGGTFPTEAGGVLRFFLVITFAGILLDLFAGFSMELLFRIASTTSWRLRRGIINNKTSQLVSVIEQDPTLGDFVVGNRFHAWKLAGRFLSQTKEMGYSPMEDLEKCASFLLVGVGALAIGSFLGGLEISTGATINLWILGALVAVGVLLMVAGQTEAANFVEGTLAGMRERLRTLREEQAKSEKTAVSTEEINRITALLNEIAGRFDKNEGVRILDSTDVRNHFQDQKNVKLLDVESVRESAVRILDRVSEETSQSVQTNLMYALTAILNTCETVDVYRTLEERYSPKYAGLVLTHLIKPSFTPFENGILSVVMLLEAPDVAKAMLKVLGDLDPSTAPFQIVSIDLANSHLGDSNRVIVRAGFREWAEKRPGNAGSLESPLSYMSQRENSQPGKLSNTPVLVRHGRIPAIGLRIQGTTA